MQNRNLKENKRFNRITYKQDQRNELSLPSTSHESHNLNDRDFKGTEFLSQQGVTMANHTSVRHENSRVKVTYKLS